MASGPTPDAIRGEKGRLPGWAPWVLVAGVSAAYVTSFGGDFQFDDGRVIVDEPAVHSLHAFWGSMPAIRPLLKLTYALNWASGLGLAGFHAANLAIHVGNALLTFALFRRLGPRRDGAALAGALLFALHPVQTEAVTYVSGRSTSLAASFALASILAWVIGRQDSRPALAYAASPVLFAASLLAKESTAVLPAILLLVEASFGDVPFRWGRALRATALHWAVLGAGALAFASAPAYRSMVEGGLALRPHGVNLLTHLHSLAWLSGQVLRIDRLNADPALPQVSAPTGASALEALGLVLALLLGLAFRRRPAGFAALWFLLWLPAAGWWLPRPEPANDRQLYLALAGPAWLAGRGLASFLAAGRLRRAAAAALLAALALATAARNCVYADDVGFWEDVVAKAPWNARGFNNLGFALARACRLAEAETALAEAVRLDPGYVRAKVNLRLLREGQALAPPAEGTSPCGAEAN
ncbi:MAG TPA: hypothetical protein VMT17_01105 [Anaeromyxobacteraceae bacterium]|nr:hypothetical protein [Anaeromyxobacteraceae bacterium]